MVKGARKKRHFWKRHHVCVDFVHIEIQAAGKSGTAKTSNVNPQYLEIVFKLGMGNTVLSSANIFQYKLASATELL